MVPTSGSRGKLWRGEWMGRAVPTILAGPGNATRNSREVVCMRSSRDLEGCTRKYIDFWYKMSWTRPGKENHMYGPLLYSP